MTGDQFMPWRQWMDSIPDPLLRGGGGSSSVKHVLESDMNGTKLFG
jgi:hypothetical protein